MPQKRWLAIVTWTDNDVIDSEEIAVFAESESQAESLARAIWTAANGAAWPKCRIDDIQIFSYARLRTLAES